LVSGSRDVTTVPSQALFMLNGGFVRQNALKLAHSLLEEANAADSLRIRSAYNRVLGREPSSLEIARVESFLRDYAADLGQPAGTPEGADKDEGSATAVSLATAKTTARPKASRKKGKAAKPETGKPETGKPETGKPETGKPEAVLAEPAKASLVPPTASPAAVAAATSGAAVTSGAVPANAPPAPRPPVNPDDVDQSGVATRETEVVANGPREAAWMAFVQALYASAEFRYVR
ncbi:MAG: DUF1553 domain-containing protein, partial [Planctomycetota bacterium]